MSGYGRRIQLRAAALWVALAVVLGLLTYLFIPRDSTGGPAVAGSAASARPHAGSAGRPGTPTSSAPTAPGPAPGGGQVVPLPPASARAFGPGGGSGDNPQLAARAIDGSTATAWHTDWYTTATFGGLYQGTGLLLDMGRTVTVSQVRISLGGEPGVSFQVRVGASPALASLPEAASAGSAGGTVSVRLPAPAHGRYVLIWFTRLAPDPSGTYQASVANVRVLGTS